METGGCRERNGRIHGFDPWKHRAASRARTGGRRGGVTNRADPGSLFGSALRRRRLRPSGRGTGSPPRGATRRPYRSGSTIVTRQDPPPLPQRVADVVELDIPEEAREVLLTVIEQMVAFFPSED